MSTASTRKVLTRKKFDELMGWLQKCEQGEQYLRARGNVPLRRLWDECVDGFFLAWLIDRAAFHGGTPSAWARTVTVWDETYAAAREAGMQQFFPHHRRPTARSKRACAAWAEQLRRTFSYSQVREWLLEAYDRLPKES